MSYDPARVKSLFLAASDLDTAEERAAFLDRECGDDPALRARVEVLLAAQDRADPHPLFDSRPEPGSVATLPDAAAETLAGSIAPTGSDFGATVAATVNGEPGVTIGGAGPGPIPAGFAPGGVVAGRYTLLWVLGEGGMGTVYLAEQTSPVRRQVALKLIRTGMDSRTVLARFDAERQALAMMDHPNIARVYDAGATDSGQPFFAMEYVRGEPITDYCDRNHLPVEARLRLLVDACQAVQHAHQKGIIHRDLKPSNVLVAEVDGRPTPKVIDFGVAKASGFELTDRTLGDTGAIVGTPAYMSPEQADPSSMDIDTRTDVYALGVILYELLAGSPPIDPAQFRRGAVLEMLRMVREVEPAKPSTRVSTADALPNIAANRAIEPGRLKRELRGDLDWIALKALEKDRTRRYETANGLAADILRHLASEPVQAAPPSRSYRTRKFVAKHRVGVAAAALVLLALVGGIAGTSWGLVAARHATEAERLAKLDAREKKTLAEANEGRAFAAAEAEKQARLDAQKEKALAEANEKRALAAAEAEKQAKETVEDVLGFVEGKVFAAARPKGQDGGLGYDVRLADAITAALPAIEGGFPGKPLTEARLRRTIGQSFRDLGKPDLAATQLEASQALFSRHQGPTHPDTLSSMNHLANIYHDLGRQAEALKLREETLALQKAKLGSDHPGTLISMEWLATSYIALAHKAEAIKLYEETLALRRAKLGPNHPDTLRSTERLANFYLANGREREGLPLLAAASSAKPKDTNLSMKVAALQVWYGLGEEFAATRRRAFANARGTRDASTAERAAKVGSLLPSAEGPDLDPAIGFGRRAVELGKDNPFLDYFLMSLGMAQYRKGQFAEALATLDEARASTKHHPEYGGKLNYAFDGTTAFFRAMCLSRLGRDDEARAVATEAAAKVKPPPADGQNPLAGGADHDDLILWLAYREAKALIGFDPPPAAPAKPEGR